jgi:pimeloyl-ACP methyl ester carboxylesterase
MTTSRRALIAGSVVAAAGAAAGSVAGPAVASPDTVARGPGRTRGPEPARSAVSPFNSATFNGEGLFVLGAAGAGTADVGEVLTAFDRVNARTGNPSRLLQRDFDAYVDEFLASGHSLAALAGSSEQAGQVVSARYQHLRAGNYLTQALFFVLGTGHPAREEEFFDLVNEQWQAARAAMTPAPSQFTVRAGRYAIPVYFFRPDDTGAPRPTLIISNGSDGQNVETMQFGVVAGLERGYNVALFEGPGQMSLLFRHKIPFTPDWDQIIGPIAGALAARNDVRSDRIALIGLSFAGMLCARAAARTPGLRAVVLEPAAYDLALIWDDPKNLAIVRKALHAPPVARAKIRRQVNAGFVDAWPYIPAETQFVIHKRSEIFQAQALQDARAGRPPSDYFGLLEAILRFDYTADYRKITIPALLTANEGDEFFGRQAYHAFDLLTSLPARDKKLIVFTTAHGAQLHDQPMAPQFAQETVFAWLATHLQD